LIARVIGIITIAAMAWLSVAIVVACYLVIL